MLTYAALIAVHLHCGTIVMPPEQYLTPDLPVDPTIRLMPYYQIDAFYKVVGGAPLPRGSRVEAFNIPDTNNSHHVPTIVLPSDESTQRQMCHFIHEKAHLLGWGGDHPGGMYLN